MVVGAEQDDHPVRAALPLVQVVRAVGVEVGGPAVGPDQHPVLVVAEVGRPQPDRAVRLVHVALLPQPGDGELDLAVDVQRALREVDVELDSEGLQRAPDRGEHQRDALAPEDVERLVLRLVEHRRVGRDHRGRDLGDVRTGVALLGGRPPGRRGQQRGGEAVDLGTGVVEVVLPGHLGAGRAEQPAQRVADRRPPAVRQVHRSGRVGRDVLQVEALPGQRVAPPVRRAGVEHRAHQAGQRVLGEGQVEEAGAGDVHPVDARVLPQPGGEQLGHLPRRPAGGLGQPERDVGGIVAVLAALRALHDRGVRHGHGEVAGPDRRADGVEDGGGELGGSHAAMLLRRCGEAHGAFTPPTYHGRVPRNIQSPPLTEARACRPRERPPARASPAPRAPAPLAAGPGASRRR